MTKTNMQVFMPYADFERTHSVLDSRRLTNQVLRECKTLLNGGWSHHPVSKLWAGHLAALQEYTLVGLYELKRRGIARATWEQHYDWLMSQHYSGTSVPDIIINNPEFCRRHRSQLLSKNFVHYAEFFLTDEPNLVSGLDYIGSI